MHKAIATIVILFTAAALFAQKPLGQRQAETLQMEQYQRTRDSSSLASEAEWLQSDLVRKANKFALVWAQFTAEVNARHTFDVKLAKKLDKAFNDLQKARGWPDK